MSCMKLWAQDMEPGWNYVMQVHFCKLWTCVSKTFVELVRTITKYSGCRKKRDTSSWALPLPLYRNRVRLRGLPETQKVNLDLNKLCTCFQMPLTWRWFLNQINREYKKCFLSLVSSIGEQGCASKRCKTVYLRMMSGDQLNRSPFKIVAMSPLKYWGWLRAGIILKADSSP